MTNVEVTLPDGREIVVVDFQGSIDDACAMVDRHYPDAVKATFRITCQCHGVHDADCPEATR